jgi:hypothetical protein
MKRSFVCSQWFLLSSETTASRVVLCELVDVISWQFGRIINVQSNLPRTVQFLYYKYESHMTEYRSTLSGVGEVITSIRRYLAPK